MAWPFFRRSSLPRAVALGGLGTSACLLLTLLTGLPACLPSSDGSLAPEEGCANDPWEPNDASALASTTPWSEEAMACEGDVDWFALTTGWEDQLDILIRFDESLTGLTAEVLDKNEQALSRSMVWSRPGRIEITWAPFVCPHLYGDDDDSAMPAGDDDDATGGVEEVGIRRELDSAEGFLRVANTGPSDVPYRVSVVSNWVCPDE